jgi:hypothetical protein
MSLADSKKLIERLWNAQTFRPFCFWSAHGTNYQRA